MSFENECIVAFHRCRNVRRGANPKGASDIGSAVEVLSAGIEQEHTFALDSSTLLGCGMVVHDSTIAFPSCDGAEAVVGIVSAHSAEIA